MIIVRPERWLAAAALVAGTAAWILYLQQGLVLSHYDAKAHLVVARRVIDSLTPGWQQVGAVWLPLPHLIQILPTQIDLFYRTGAFGSFVSILSFTVAVWAAARLVGALTGSALGATTAAALLLLNPNLLYLQSTPMTEPLLLALTFLVVLWTYEWVAVRPAESTDRRVLPRPQNRPPAALVWALFAATWTRYEAWPVIALTIGAAAWATWRQGAPPAAVLRRTLALSLAPAVAVLLFLINSRITVGAWFVTGGFYVPDPAYEGQAWRTLVAVWWGTHRLSGYAIEIVALLAAAVLAWRGVTRRDEAPVLVPLALFAAAALPLYAFYEGHPFRIRYMVPVVAASAVFCGIAVAIIGRMAHARPASSGGQGRPTGARRARVYAAPAAAALLIASSLVESPPLRGDAPLLQEAQWDLPHSAARRIVTACLAPNYRGEKVMASMGSLAHYMQELSRHGFAIRDFLHEGNGAIWNFAMTTGPAPHAGWMLVEEQAEGGDVLAQRIRADAAFTQGMSRMCEGGGVALYRRAPASRRTARQP